MRAARVSMAVVSVLLVLASCGVPSDSENRPLDPSGIPAIFNQTTSTTTTTTTTTVTTPAPTDAPTSVPAELVSLYFVAGSQVVPISRQLLSPAAAPQVLAALAEGLPSGDEAAGLRTALPADFSAGVDVERGIATVDLPPTFLNQVPGPEQRLAVAQIVLTLTRRAGIGQVVFTSGAQPQAVPRGRGDLTRPGELVACDDYANLLPFGFSC